MFFFDIFFWCAKNGYAVGKIVALGGPENLQTAWSVAAWIFHWTPSQNQNRSVVSLLPWEWNPIYNYKYIINYYIYIMYVYIYICNVYIICIYIYIMYILYIYVHVCKHVCMYIYIYDIIWDPIIHSSAHNWTDPPLNRFWKLLITVQGSQFFLVWHGWLPIKSRISRHFQTFPKLDSD